MADKIGPFRRELNDAVRAAADRGESYQNIMAKR